MNVRPKICPWCRTKSISGKLCSNCRNQAESLGRISLKEFERLPYGAIKVDEAGVIIRVNRAERDMSGLKKEDYIGKSFFDVAPCTNVRAFKGRFNQFLKSSHQATHEFNFIYRINHQKIVIRITIVRLPYGALILASQK